MLRMSKRPAVPGLSSTLSFATTTFPVSSAASSSRAGAIIRQGPHHGAHASTSTGSGERSTSAANVASVTVMGFVTPPSGDLHRPQTGCIPAATFASGTRLVAPQLAQRMSFVSGMGRPFLVCRHHVWARPMKIKGPPAGAACRCHNRRCEKAFPERFVDGLDRVRVRRDPSARGRVARRARKVVCRTRRKRRGRRAIRAVMAIHVLRCERPQARSVVAGARAGRLPNRGIACITVRAIAAACVEGRAAHARKSRTA